MKDFLVFEMPKNALYSSTADQKETRQWLCHHQTVYPVLRTFSQQPCESHTCSNSTCLLHSYLGPSIPTPVNHTVDNSFIYMKNSFSRWRFLFLEISRENIFLFRKLAPLHTENNSLQHTLNTYKSKDDCPTISMHDVLSDS